MTDEQTRTIELPERTVSRVEDRLPGTEFTSPDDYVAFVVAEVLHSTDPSDAAVDVDEQQVKDRLESLGYLES